MKITLILLLTMFFYEASSAQKFSDKISINPKLKHEFKNRDSCMVVFDAFKDCRCFLDTTKKEIDIEAGEADGGGSEYLHFQINTDMKVKAEHIYYSDDVPVGNGDPYPPFPIPDFYIEANKNPFNKSKNGFLLKYKLGENRPIHSTFTDKSYEFTGFINCHHVTIHKKEYKILSSTDSVDLAITFLKDPLLLKIIKLDQPDKIKNMTGAVQEWLKPIPGFKLLKYEELKTTKEPVISIVVANIYNAVLNGSRLVIWTYWNKGVKRYFSAFEYQKFADKWIFMRAQYIQDLKTKKYLHLK